MHAAETIRILEPKPGKAAEPYLSLIFSKKRDLIIFLVSVVLFHFGNAAMLPMAGQVSAKTHPGSDIVALSACIITAQLVMIGIAAMVGWAIRRGIGRKIIFVVAFLTLPSGFLFTLTDSPYGVMAIQLLDSVAAGIFGVISIIIAADLMRSTGRFNFAQGLVALSTGLRATSSNLCSGFVVQSFVYTVGFINLAWIAVGGLIFFALLMPETKPEEGIGSMSAQGDNSSSEACLRTDYRPCANFIRGARQLGLINTAFCTVSFVGTEPLINYLGNARTDRAAVNSCCRAATSLCNVVLLVWRLLTWFCSEATVVCRESIWVCGAAMGLFSWAHARAGRIKVPATKTHTLGMRL